MLFPHLILSEDLIFNQGGIEMGSMVCMNELCRSTTSSEWKKGWALKSGGFVKLCYNCGSLFENLVFCETFHPEESGWRECRTCRKRIHCGCIASKCLYDYLDYGGVACISCTSHLDGHSISPIQVPGDDLPNGSPGTKSAQLLGFENKTEENNNFEKKRIIRFSKPVDPSETAQPFQTQKNDTNASPGNVKQEIMLPLASSLFIKSENEGPGQGVKDVFGSINQPSLHFSLSTNSCDAEGREQSKNSPFHQGQRTRHILPKPPKHSPSPGSESKKEMALQTRVPRPPAEGRGGRNQLLPRYWPRITDQELQKISGDLKSTIVPLFEKVLSASDAGRIGRLVLPKACAEAYFPPINQSEGLPIRIQDIKGKEWTFQFRFWPNNNSRMYVLEGVTPCIQNMQLQAGDTVIFSRIDPGGKLVMGFRKATNNGDMQETQTSNLHNGSGYSETSFSGTAEILMNGCRISDDSVRQVSISEKKKARNIGSKSKRLLMNADDAMELRITWEEAQELLRPPPATKPTIVMIEDYEFEEYDEPPVFGKKTIFTARSSGVDQEQWAQCDSCSKWRRLPVHVLLPAKWTCSDNMWDPRRCSCGAPDEINPRELEAFYRVSKDQKRRKIVESNEDCEPTGLDALAALAVLGDNMGELGESSVGATTKHPRHRPGCTCIVCIQPPSGKGKHQPMCKCNVCLTVKRRFKTLMLRKKKKQSEREAQAKDQADAASGTELLQMNAASENEQMNQSEIETDQLEEFGPGKGQLDLNCDPSRDDDVALAATAGMSITSLVTAADLPLEYLGQNGLETLGNSLLSQAPGETSEGHHPGEASEGHHPGETSEGHHPDNGFVKSADAEHHENRC